MTHYPTSVFKSGSILMAFFRQLCRLKKRPLQPFSGNWLKSLGCIGGGTRSLASCIACPACLKPAFMLTSSRTALLMPRNTLHGAILLMALSSNTAVFAWPRRFCLLASLAWTPLGFRRARRVSFARVRMICICPQEQLLPQGASFAWFLRPG